MNMRLIDARLRKLISEEEYKEYVRKHPDDWKTMKIQVDVPDNSGTDYF